MNCNAKMSRSEKGFTLAELLIVVAIIAVLVAIAIPVYSAQLESARYAVDKANLNSAKNLVEMDWILDYSGTDDINVTYYYTVGIDKDDNITVQNEGTQSTPVGDIWQSKTAAEDGWKDATLSITDGELAFSVSVK